MFTLSFVKIKKTIIAPIKNNISNSIYTTGSITVGGFVDTHILINHLIN